MQCQTETTNGTIEHRAPMKRIFCFVAAGVVVCLALTALSPSEPLHFRLASDPALKGKGKENQCMDYALALSSKACCQRYSRTTDILPMAYPKHSDRRE